MKQSNKLLGAIIAGLLNTAAFAGVDELVNTSINPIFDSSISYASENIWRGAQVGDHLLGVNIGTSFNLPTDITIDLNSWYAETDTDGDEFINTVKFSKDISDYTVALSYSWYSVDFDRTSGNAQEIGASVSRDFGPLNVSFTQYIATEGDNDAYSAIAATYSSDFNTLPFVLDFYSEVGYVAEHNTATHALLKVSADFPISDTEVVISPFVTGSISLGEGSGVHSSTENYVAAGIEIKRSF